MRTKIPGRLLCPTLLALLAILFNKPCTSNILTAKNLGIQFTVHQHHSYNETLEDVERKMELVSSQFEAVFAFGTLARNDGRNYAVGETYNKSFSQVYAAEAAGRLSEKGPKSPKIYIGIHPHNDENLFRKEVELARESALLSERHKPKTVQGFVLDFKEVSLDLEKINTAFEILNSSSQLENIYYGLRMNCDTILNDTRHISVILGHSHHIIHFLLCVEHPSINLDGKQAFSRVATKFQNVNATITREHPSVYVIGQTGYPARGNVKADVEQMRKFWEAADMWATKNHFRIVMTEAFDNPWKKWNDTVSHEGHYGWWGITKNSNTGKFSVFEQKVSELGPVVHSNTTSNTNTTSKPTNGGVGLKTFTSFRYGFAILGMIIIGFVI